MHLNAVPGIKASVWSGGRELKEYDDPHDEEDEGPKSKVTARKYIEAVDGAVFEVRVEALPSYKFDCDRLAAFISVDGKIIAGRSIKPHKRKATFLGREEYLRHAVNLHKFLFSRIEATEEHDARKPLVKVDEIGEIKIEVYRLLPGGEYQPRSQAEVIENVAEKLSEKQLKGRAVSHGTSYGKPERIVGSRTTRTSIYADGNKKPLAVLKILYRSKAALQAMLIIPRTPSPPPLPALRDRTNANEQNLSAKMDVKVKKEKHVKREHDGESKSGREKKRRPTFIDLTDDVDEASPVSLLKTFKTENGKPGIDLT